MTWAVVDYPEILPQCINFPASKTRFFPFMALVVDFGFGFFCCIALGIRHTHTQCCFSVTGRLQKNIWRKICEERHILIWGYRALHWSHHVAPFGIILRGKCVIRSTVYITNIALCMLGIDLVAGLVLGKNQADNCCNGQQSKPLGKGWSLSCCVRAGSLAELGGLKINLPLVRRNRQWKKDWLC